MSDLSHFTKESLQALTRRKLQDLAKKHGIKANIKSDAIIEQLLQLQAQELEAAAEEEHQNTASDAEASNNNDESDNDTNEGVLPLPRASPVEAYRPPHRRTPTAVATNVQQGAAPARTNAFSSLGRTYARRSVSPSERRQQREFQPAMEARNNNIRAGPRIVLGNIPRAPSPSAVLPLIYGDALPRTPRRDASNSDSLFINPPNQGAERSSWRAPRPSTPYARNPLTRRSDDESPDGHVPSQNTVAESQPARFTVYRDPPVAQVETVLQHDNEESEDEVESEPERDHEREAFGGSSEEEEGMEEQQQVVSSPMGDLEYPATPIRGQNPLPLSPLSPYDNDDNRSPLGQPTGPIIRGYFSPLNRSPPPVAPTPAPAPAPAPVPNPVTPQYRTKPVKGSIFPPHHPVWQHKWPLVSDGDELDRIEHGPLAHMVNGMSPPFYPFSPRLREDGTVITPISYKNHDDRWRAFRKANGYPSPEVPVFPGYELWPQSGVQSRLLYLPSYEPGSPSNRAQGSSTRQAEVQRVPVEMDRPSNDNSTLPPSRENVIASPDDRSYLPPSSSPWGPSNPLHYHSRRLPSQEEEQRANANAQDSPPPFDHSALAALEDTTLVSSPLGFPLPIQASGSARVPRQPVLPSTPPRRSNVVDREALPFARGMMSPPDRPLVGVPPCRNAAYQANPSGSPLYVVRRRRYSPPEEDSEEEEGGWEQQQQEFLDEPMDDEDDVADDEESDKENEADEDEADKENLPDDDEADKENLVYLDEEDLENDPSEDEEEEEDDYLPGSPCPPHRPRRRVNVAHRQQSSSPIPDIREPQAQDLSRRRQSMLQQMQQSQPGPSSFANRPPAQGAPPVAGSNKDPKRPLRTQSTLLVDSLNNGGNRQSQRTLGTQATLPVGSLDAPEPRVDFFTPRRIPLRPRDPDEQEQNEVEEKDEPIRAMKPHVRKYRRILAEQADELERVRLRVEEAEDVMELAQKMLAKVSADLEGKIAPIYDSMEQNLLMNMKINPALVDGTAFMGQQQREARHAWFEQQFRERQARGGPRGVKRRRVQEEEDEDFDVGDGYEVQSDDELVTPPQSGEAYGSEDLASPQRRRSPSANGLETPQRSGDNNQETPGSANSMASFYI